MWLNKYSDVYSKSVKSWLRDNEIEMYSIHNEEKSLVAERFIGTLKNIVCKYMSLIFKMVYIDQLNYTVNKYNDTYHKTIKMKHILNLM